MSLADPPPSPADETERLAGLARLISPVVHRVNNSLAVLRGACDLMLQQCYSDHLLRASEETSRIADTLARLSSCAKTHSPSEGPFDLASAVESAELLLGALSSAHRVEVLDRVGTSEPIPVRGDRMRLEQLLVWFAAEAIARRTPAPATERMRLRLSLRRTRTGAVLSILRREVGNPEEPTPTASLEAARAFGARGDVTVTAGSRFGGVTYLRFVFPVSGSLPQVVRQRKEATRPSPRVFLVEGNTPRRGLVHTVLEEQGYRVQIPSCETPAPEDLLLDAVDLLLVDASQVERRDGFLREVRRAAEASGSTRLAILGTTSHMSGFDDVPCLAKPFRPGELLDFVAAQLS